MRRHGRACERTRAHLPTHAAGGLPGWRRRLVERHLRRCTDCTAELIAQRHVAQQLASMGAEADGALATTPVPDDLLDTLLSQARDPGLRARAAVPVRGAVSGARPELTAAFGLGLLVLLAGALWAGWRIGRAWRSVDD